jgi:hypothetical protein
MVGRIEPIGRRQVRDARMCLVPELSESVVSLRRAGALAVRVRNVRGKGARNVREGKWRARKLLQPRKGLFRQRKADLVDSRPVLGGRTQYGDIK